MRNIKLLFLLCGLLFASATWAQTVVTGTVTDEQNLPLAGATVLVKGTNNGTSTDFDGNFSIEANVNSDILEVSYIGFSTLEVPINGQSSLNVRLTEDATQLEDVVVVGYGTQKKSDVTGSIASVKSEDFNQGVVANPGQLLQGKVSGVNITNVSGEPGASQNVIIRGVGSLRSGTAPLYVIDGFVISNNDIGMGSSPLNFINLKTLPPWMFLKMPRQPPFTVRVRRTG